MTTATAADGADGAGAGRRTSGADCRIPSSIPPANSSSRKSRRVEVEAEAPQPMTPEADDFFVLPGESLAKYTGPSSDEGEESEEVFGDAPIAEMSAEPEAAVAEPEPSTATPAAIAGEPVSEIAAEPAAEPQPELSAAAAEVAEAEAADEEAVETAEDVEPLPVDAAEPLEAVEEGAAPEESAGEVSAAAENVAEEEGPEPARIPTSLTATLREQGPRYLHRVSRRMRRRGREGGREGGRDGGREGRPPAEGQRGPQPGPAPEARPAEPAPRTEQRTVQAPRSEPRPEKNGAPSISDLLKEGQEIIVQIAKEPLGQKGARITSHIALPGRFLVYMPTVDHIGVSRKIPSDDERLRLKRILQGNRTGIPGGFIVRTAGEGRTRGRTARRHDVPLQPVAGHAPEGRAQAGAPADPSRPECRGAGAARPAHLGVQEHLGG